MANYAPRTKDYKGVVLNIQLHPHDAKREKLTLSFNVNDTGYDNAKMLPKGSSDYVIAEALTELEDWAHTIINENTK